MTQNSNKPQKPQILKLSRDSKFKNSFHPVIDKKLEEDYQCTIFVGDFLYDVYCFIYHLGSFIEEDLAKGKTHFSMNSYFADIIKDNKIRLYDGFELANLEMDLDEFLRVNDEYHKLYHSNATDIVFKIVDGKIKLEGYWENF